MGSEVGKRSGEQVAISADALEPEIVPSPVPDDDEGEGDGESSFLTPDQLDPFGEPAPVRAPLPVHLSLVPRDMDSDALLSADPLTAYLAHLRYIEPLSAEDQQALAERYYEEHDVEAAKLLILSNVRLVVKIAREYRRRRESLMELIQEGNVGLAEAIRRYDPYRGVKFTSYAQYWVRAMIMNYLMNIGQTLKLGSTRSGRKLFFNLRKERERLLEELQVPPSPKLLADRLGVPEKEVVDVMRVMDSQPLSIDAPAPGYETTNLGSILSDDESASPEDTVVDADVRSTFSAALAEFGASIEDERDRVIWTERILAEEPRSLQELGDRFDVSRERVRQLEVKLKKRVETFLRSRFGDEEIELAIGD
jgi:RNA polymerase sigma-32 factor